MPEIIELYETVERQAAEIERLRMALCEYGEHTTCCKSIDTLRHEDCNCGWRSVLDTLYALDEQTKVNIKVHINE